MTVPLVVLAALSVVGGLIGIPASLSLGHDLNFLGRWLAPALASVGAAHGQAPGSQAHASETHAAPAHHEIPPLEYAAMGVSLAVALTGIGLAWLLYRRRTELAAALARALGPLHRLLYHKYFVDELYDAAVVRPLLGWCRAGRWFDVWVVDFAVNGVRHVTVLLSFVSAAWDKYFIDLLLVNGAGYAVRTLAWMSRRLQTGVVQSYAMAMVFGVLVFVSIYLFYNVR